MKEISLQKHTTMQVSGNFKSWAKDMKDHLFWHDDELIEYLESTRIMDQKLSYEELGKCGVNRKLKIEVEFALR